MPEIYVDFNKMKQIGSQCKTLSSQIRAIDSEFQQIIRQLDWDVKYQSNINGTAMQLSQKMGQYTAILEKYRQFIEEAYEKYSALDCEKFEIAFDTEGLPIFNGLNGYGGDQTEMSEHKNGMKFLWWVFGEDKELYDFIRSQEGYEQYSEAQIHKLIDSIKQEGCGYVALVNALFAEFSGNEAEFEKSFGFSMYDKEGNYNYNKMLADIYCRTDDKYFLTETNGKQALVNDIYSSYQKRPNKFEREYGVKYDAPFAEREHAILSRYTGETVVYKAKGTTTYSQENRLLGYLSQKGISADVDCNTFYQMSTKAVEHSLDSGSIVKLSLAKGTVFYDENGNSQGTLDGGHAVLVTEVTDEGQYVISSWGRKYYINPEESSTAINSYLTIDVAYQ